MGRDIRRMRNSLYILFTFLIFFTLFNGLRLWGNYLFSMSRVQEALVVEPYNYLYHFAFGTALLQAKQSTLAIRHLQEAIGLNPSYTDALSNLAVALILEKRYVEAREVFAELNRLDPKDGYGIENLRVLEKMMKEPR